jgi:hypothetical protein
MDTLDLVIHMTPEQREQVETMAHQRGYGGADDYLLALVDLDAQGKLALLDTDDDLTQEQLEANFKQGLKEVMTGQVYPIEQLWDVVDDD